MKAINRSISFSILLIVACCFSCDHGGDSGGTGGSEDTQDIGDPELIDDDGDGAYLPAPGVALDLIDCDDQDDSITPANWRYVPAGPFLRGQDGEPGADPQREIWLSAYCVQVHEVTVVGYADYLMQAWADGQLLVLSEGLASLDGERWIDTVDIDDEVPERIIWGEDGVEILEGYEQHPINEVTWAGSRAFCVALGGDLPTEAQWEKAARGGCELGGDPMVCDEGDTNIWPWGEQEINCDLANYALILAYDEEGWPYRWDHCVGDTLPVGSNLENLSPYGLTDMAGNISEWVLDLFDEEYYAESDDTDPAGPETGGFMNPQGEWVDAYVSRGGGWMNADFAATVYARMPEPTFATSNNLGFRCARTAPGW